ncbi:hypothetical protein ACFVZH_22690 [Streptomyces sp. NPDC059534]|uniref:DUF6197 family protein n=1 Tax=Streptomyces sp. NPDC059534 TaxID=3346859 RepID=UPI00367B8ECE
MTTNSISRPPLVAQPRDGGELTSPTNLPAFDRRPVLVLLPSPRPTTVPTVLLGAARILAANGLWQGDYVPDTFNREMCIPHFLRPMSIVAALKCAASGDPHRDSPIADQAISALAMSIDDGPYWGDTRSLEAHVDEWGDEAGRSTDEAVALLERLATTSERAA